MSNSSRMNRPQNPKIVVQHSRGAAGVQAPRADERTALEFSEVLRRRGETEGTEEHVREVTASTEREQQQASFSSTQVNQHPSMFFQTGSSHGGALGDDSFDPVALSAVSSSDSIPSRVAVIAQSETSKIPPAEAIVESIYRDWVKSNSQPQARKWILELQTGENTQSELAIEYTSSGEWQLELGPDEEGSFLETQTSDARLAASIDVDLRQFCHELEERLKVSQPGLRFSAHSRD